MPRPSIPLVVVVAAMCLHAHAVPPAPPAVFEGLGLGDMSAAGSVARALRAELPDESRQERIPLDVVVRGPGGGSLPTAPLAAEVRGRIESIDMAAGLQGQAEQLAAREPCWTGRIAVGEANARGAAAVELRTRLESRDGRGRLGVEIGPRLERRLPRGARLFLDGTATAEAIRDADAGGWHLPGTSMADTEAAIGLSARTGIAR